MIKSTSDKLGEATAAVIVGIATNRDVSLWSVALIATEAHIVPMPTPAVGR